MKANRKADLERKLTLAPAPKPPAGLADRIKTEIPKHLRFNAESERKRFSGSVMFSMRVAASILILISSLYLAVRFLSRAENERGQVAVAVPKRVAAAPAVAAAAPPPAVFAERDKDDRQPKALALRKEKPQSVVAAAEELKVAKSEPMISVTANAPIITPPPPAAAGVAAQAGARRTVYDSIAVSRSVAKVTDRPTESVIQRFSTPATLPTGTIALDAEAVRGRFDDTTIYLRASADSGIAARDVRMDVLLNPDAVPRFRWLAGSWRWLAGSFADQSRTSLAQIGIAKVLDDSARIATIRLSYRVGDDPTEYSIEKIIRRGDIVTWPAASQRMKSASLAGDWTSGQSAPAVAEAAREAGLSELAKFVEETP